MAIIRQPQQIAAVTDDERARPRDCANLLTELVNPNPITRRWAARDLADCPDSSSTLVARLACEDEPSVRDVILSSLTFLGDKVAVSGLVQCLRSDHAALRNEAIEAMKQMPDQVAPIMQQLLMDDDADVRIFAVNILESLRHPEVESWLIAVIENDPQVNVCATAVDLLGEVGSDASRNALQRLKARFTEEPYIQFATDLAIKRLAQG